jgi:hypothetical protein
MSYLYYLIYKFVLLTPSKNEQPEHIANMSLALILSLTLFGILNIFEFYGLNMLEKFWENKILFVITYMCFLILGYYFFIRNRKYIDISQKFDKGTKMIKIRNASFFVSYIILLILSISL